jgi:hypothetical protein
MSATLEKLMMLQQMNSSPSVPLAMSEDQRRAAQGDAIMRIAAEMGRTGHKGRGFGRALSAMNASIDPALDAYNQAEQTAMAENAMKQKMMTEQQREAKRDAMDILKEDRAHRKEMRDEAYDRRYLEIMDKKGSSKDTGKVGSDAKERRILWNALGNDAKAEEYRKGMILNWSPTETQANFLKGIHPEDAAAEQGINLAEHEGSYLLTGSGRNQIKQAEGIEAEINSLTESTAEDLGYFGPQIPGFGVSANEMFDSLTGANKEKRLRGLGAAAIQAELAGARARFAGASSAQEAIHGMQESALATVKAFAPGITGADRVYVQRYINERLEEAFKARKRAVMGLSKQEKSEPKALTSSAQTAKSKVNPYEKLSEEELMQLIGGE